MMDSTASDGKHELLPEGLDDAGGKPSCHDQPVGMMAGLASHAKWEFLQKSLSNTVGEGSRHYQPAVVVASREEPCHSKLLQISDPLIPFSG